MYNKVESIYMKTSLYNTYTYIYIIYLPYLRNIAKLVCSLKINKVQIDLYLMFLRPISHHTTPQLCIIR